MIEIRMIPKENLWKYLKHEGLINVILFGGQRFTFVDEVIAAFDGIILVGAVTLSAVGEYGTGEPAIIGLLVTKGWRRKKIGTRLMERAIRRMDERGLTPIYVDVLSEALKRLIEKLDESLKQKLIVNDLSKEADCFDMIESIKGSVLKLNR